MLNHAACRVVFSSSSWIYFVCPAQTFRGRSAPLDKRTVKRNQILVLLSFTVELLLPSLSSLFSIRLGLGSFVSAGGSVPLCLRSLEPGQGNLEDPSSWDNLFQSYRSVLPSGKVSAAAGGHHRSKDRSCRTWLICGTLEAAEKHAAQEL